ncbi:MAG: hypothetical protein QOG86_813 [Thermoleophilaceae bacterium]|nr:hypothetical protein [Thermoleophilaceae bacterium]
MRTAFRSCAAIAVAAAALAVAAALALPAVALATPASSAEVASLARAAAGGDAAALARLRSVDVVDGRPLPVGTALAGAKGAALRARLRTLAAGTGGAGGAGGAAGSGRTGGAGPVAGPTATTSAAARERAAAILRERRFHGGPGPRPLHGVFTAIGEAAKAVIDPIGRLLHRIGSGFPGGAPVFWLLVAGLVIAAAAALTSRSVRRRAAAVERLRGETVGGPGGKSPDALEREADEAERAGDLEHAVRLRFRAGLLRLDLVHAIDFRPAITTTEVSGALHSPAFDELALTFEEVAYGGRPAAPPDVEAARREWPALLAEVGGR